MPVVEMVCLANSRKRQGKCVAGLRVDGEGWVRPVAPTPEGALFPAHYRLQDGTEPQPLDVIRVGCTRHAPRPHQPENWVIDGTPWMLVSRPLPAAARPVLQGAVVSGPALFGNVFDRVPDHFRAAPAQSSLALVAPERLSWQIRLTQNFTRQTRALFTLGGVHYNLSLTDPVWERKLHHLAEGDHALAAAGITASDNVLLTISLSEPFNGDCYKLVAAVIVT